MSSISCNNIGGTRKEGHACDGAFICCTEELQLQTCSEQDGRICDSDEICDVGEEVGAFGLDSGETCCIGGTCEEAPEISRSECEDAGGFLDVKDLIFSCEDSETCLDGRTACEVRDDILDEICEESWVVGEDSPIKGYKLSILKDDAEIFVLF